MLTSLLSLPSRLLRPAARRSPAPRRTVLAVEWLEQRDVPSVSIAPTTLPNPKVGVSYSETLTASGGASPYRFTRTSGSLPAGLSLSNTGTISGTPTAGGQFTFTVQASDAGSPALTGSQNYTLTVDPPTITLSPTKLTSATVGKSYTQTITAGGGTAPYQLTETGTLPAGVTFKDNGDGTATLSGTPTQAGTFNNVTIKATDSTTGITPPPSQSQSYTLTVKAPTITLSPKALKAVVAGASVSESITATGGTSPYTFSVSKGSLPKGLLLDPNTGKITGTTDAVGTFTFTVTAKDASTGTGAPFAGSHSYALAVNPATLVFLTQPGDALINANLATFTVEALDKSGKPVSGQVTLRLVPVVTVAAGAFKSGGKTLKATLVNGVATFSKVAITARGRYVLKASVGSVSVFSEPFDIGMNGRHSP